MPEFSATSAGRLATCHTDLQRLFCEVIKHFDCAVLEGHRDQETQDRYFREGKSKLPWPQGKHCSKPSLAVDVAPYVTGHASYDMKHCLYFAGFVMGVANQMGIKLRWGGDWDGDNEAMTDQTFQDLVHFELKG